MPRPARLPAGARRPAFLTCAAAVAVVALLALGAASCISAPPPPPASAEQGELRYTVIMAGNRAGEGSAHALAADTWRFTFQFNDRGRGPHLTSQVTVDRRGVPVRVDVSGNDYLKNAVGEHFTWVDGKASWKNGSEQGGRDVAGRAYYLPLNDAPQSVGLLARALLAAGGRIDLLPDGEARIEKVKDALAPGPGFSRTVHLYAISGLDLEPSYVWLDDQESVFALLSGGWMNIVLAGWEGAVDPLFKVQAEVAAAQDRVLAQRLARRPAGKLVVRNALLFDPEALVSRPGTAMIVAGDRIEWVGPDRSLVVPEGAEVIDAGGKALLPGLWDSHVHLTPVDGRLNIAAGVTQVRDMANDIDQLQDMRRRWDSGEAIGPRVLMAGFIDSPGPYAGPSKVLVSTEAEAIAAVDRYKQLGYVQIKLYSSLDPKLVPPIIAHAHELGLRVSGHIPNGLTAEEAVQDGFNEIQHVNFLFLNFIPGVDTRTPQRFIQVAQHAADLDLGSPEVRNFLALLKRRHVSMDPTVAVFENMFLGRPGQLSPGWQEVADRLPPVLRRALMADGGLPVPAGMDAQYRKSFKALLAMVKALHDNGIPVEAGTDNLNGFTLHREMELYVDAGFTAPEALRSATLTPAEVMSRDKDQGSLVAGKLADFILVDGDPATRIGDIRRVVLTVKGGVVYDPAEVYRTLGVKPAV
jgi:hypothetical protein